MKTKDNGRTNVVEGSGIVFAYTVSFRMSTGRFFRLAAALPKRCCSIETVTPMTEQLCFSAA